MISNNQSFVPNSSIISHKCFLLFHKIVLPYLNPWCKGKQHGASSCIFSFHPKHFFIGSYYTDPRPFLVSHSWIRGLNPLLSLDFGTNISLFQRFSWFWEPAGLLLYFVQMSFVHISHPRECFLKKSFFLMLYSVPLFYSTNLTFMWLYPNCLPPSTKIQTPCELRLYFNPCCIPST